MGTTTATFDKWILFNSAMVNALRAGIKRETRRLVKPQPVEDKDRTQVWIWNGGRCLTREGYGAEYVHTGEDALRRAIKKTSRMQRGDTVRVRESLVRQGSAFVYKADLRGLQYPKERAADFARWYYSQAGKTSVPSIHMPGFLSRTTLRIVDVQAERLQELRFKCAIDEGIVQTDPGHDVVAEYFKLWDTINPETPASTNPWVRAYRFDVLP